MIDIDFYQHLFLATWLFVVLYRWFDKHRSTLYVLGVALVWEIAEYFYNLDSYANLKHYLLDSMYDLIAAVIAVIFCILIMRKK